MGTEFECWVAFLQHRNIKTQTKAQTPYAGVEMGQYNTL
jgi:hypothetical protein